MNKTKKVLLIDVDSTIPNLALMHISAWKKQLGYEVGFSIEDPDEVYASIVFNKNRHLADGLQFLYPNAIIDRGGAGYDLHKKLPEFVDKLKPDYSLYDMDYDLGFTSRGCCRNCYFCIVPKKEGEWRINQHPSEFHEEGHKKIVLMDNNILYSKEWFMTVTDWILENDMKVDFNQGLDIRLVDPEIASRIKELKPISHWRFAFDSLSYKDELIRGVNYLKEAGINVRSRAMFYVYLHDDVNFMSALERCRILRELNCLPYIMVNREVERTKRMTDLKRWTRPQIFFQTDFNGYDSKVRYNKR